MSIFKSFMSPLNFDSYSYASQLSRVLNCTFPLIALGYVFNEKLELGASIAMVTMGLMLIVAAFAKRKICPRWLRDTISSGLTTYNVFCLPAIIIVCSSKEGANLLFFDNGREAIMFGIGYFVFAVFTDILYNRKAEKKRAEEVDEVEV
ncbi:MAG: hypothetical protein K2M49_04545 [Muribaculaceae bacterium]|nr:hypothetical protein [Muribaculaceae bacterium]